MFTILKTLMGLGAAAAVAIVVILISSTRSTHASHSAVPTSRPQSVAPHPTPTGNPAGTTPPAPTPIVPAAAGRPTSTQSACQKNGNCRAALLALINRTRTAHGLAPYALDLAQTFGVARAACPGTRGHTQAMAASGALWRANSRHPQVSFPRDICFSVRHRAENVARSAGSKWQAIRHMQAAMLAQGRSGKDYRHLMSKRFHRIGIDIEHHGRYYYLTEDFLP